MMVSRNFGDYAIFSIATRSRQKSLFCHKMSKIVLPINLEIDYNILWHLLFVSLIIETEER